jgi:hypothetical protein
MTRARGDVERQRGDLQRESQLQQRSGMQTLAGRGVARSPMFVNPFQRRLAEQTQRQVGELESGLAGILANLEAQIRQADIGREREINQLDFDRTQYRSNTSALLGV